MHLTPKVAEVMERGAVEIKKQMNADLAGSRHFRGIAGSVNYDRKVGAGSVDYEIGPDKGSHGGALANVAYFGTSRGGGTVDLEGPWRAEAEIIADQIDALMGREVGGL
jgi:hypothetical protein